MLTITGEVLDVTSETIQGPSGSFVATRIHLLAGLRVEEVRVGRDFLPSHLPAKGDHVALVVVASAFKTRQGAGYSLTATSRVDTPKAAAQPALSGSK